MDQKLHISELISKALNQLGVQKSAEDISGLIERPRDETHGDYAFPCFLLSRDLKAPPPKIAPQVADSLSSLVESDELVASVNPAGPYVNFQLNTGELGKQLIPLGLDQTFVKQRVSNGEKLMVEFSQPNTHKAFHVGHMRNVALGDSVAKISKWAGFDVIPVNYIGDVGTHIAKCLWYMQVHYQGEIPETHRGEFLGDLYVKATEMLDFSLLTRAPHLGIISAQIESIDSHPQVDKWKVLKVNDGTQVHQVVCGGTGFQMGDFVAYAPVGERVAGREVQSVDKKGVSSEGVICSEKEISISDDKNKIFVFDSEVVLGQPIANLLAHENVDLLTGSVVEEMQLRTRQVSETLRKLEQEDPEMLKLWQETKEWSMQEFYSIYNWLNVHFEHYFFESDVAEPGKEIVKEYLEKGVFEVSEGAVGVNLEKFKLPFFLVLKSDGTGLYSTKDLALAGLKFEKYQINRNIYVVDEGQSLHFQQVFKTLELMGFKDADKCYHLAYGKVERPDGKMSSRKGNVILFSALKELLTDKITNEYLEKYRGEWTDEEISEAAQKISVSTIKYGMLNQDSVKSIVFDLDEWTARTGNTGPYLMYAYARTQSILKEVGGSVADRNFDFSQLKEDAEHLLLVKLSQFPEVVLKSAGKYEPQLICIYLYDLAKKFSSFYTQCPVLKAETEELKAVRLALVEFAGNTLKQGLELLGIETLQKM
tara:strand:+ start:3344 stop:5464 length:2121 start_codon:yes stop_codon:yes gene_type:complete